MNPREENINPLGNDLIVADATTVSQVEKTEIDQANDIRDKVMGRSILRSVLDQSKFHETHCSQVGSNFLWLFCWKERNVLGNDGARNCKEAIN